MTRKHVLGLSAALAAVAATTGFTQSHAAAHAPATVRHARQYCVVVIDKAPERHLDSRVVSRTCAASPTAQSLLAAKADNTLLVTFYENAGYNADPNPGAETSIYGRSGPCDSSGYTFEDTSGANDEVNGISSYRLYSNCNRSDIFTGTSLSGTGSTILYGDQPYVGAAWNDNVNSMGVWHD